MKQDGKHRFIYKALVFKLSKRFIDKKLSVEMMVENLLNLNTKLHPSSS